MSEIVPKVVAFVVKQIVDHPDEVTVDIVDEGDDSVVAEVHTNKSDMGRVIGRKGRVANAIRTVAQAAADEEGLTTGVEFID
jgi:predicted RNA-binding protein YlqC (UPF0109 family)